MGRGVECSMGQNRTPKDRRANNKPAPTSRAKTQVRRSPALFWISVIPYSTACIKMRNHRLLLQSLQRRTVMELWGGLSSFSGLEMEELLKAVNIVECEVHGFIYQLDDLVT
ncbi:neuromedin-S isoform X3 [Serinus canaria]|uniref:neuromedin-S isoform X3 n=1 Tax=Serinus canaria TaxID=9135 RepID=UPI0021CCCE30|nr:neuromedin-S isoform X3 [Serinus canaria]